MADDFATVDQLQQRWRPLSESEKSRAEILLGDAAAQIRVECPDIDSKIVAVPPAANPVLDPRIPERVSCDMVKRAMLADVDQPAMSNFQEVDGPFSQSGTFVNPTGDLYLTKTERHLLGCAKQKAFMVDLLGEHESDLPPWLSWME